MLISAVVARRDDDENDNDNDDGTVNAYETVDNVQVVAANARQQRKEILMMAFLCENPYGIN